jgi:hypothetical protein
MSWQLELQHHHLRSYQRCAAAFAAGDNLSRRMQETGSAADVCNATANLVFLRRFNKQAFKEDGRCSKGRYGSSAGNTSGSV